MRTHTPSATAHVIACSTVFLSHDPRYAHLVPPLAAEASAWFMHASSTLSPLLLKVMHRHWFRAVSSWMERAMVPGIMLHYMLRKRWIEDHVRTCLTQGMAQVVILGAGLDTLALRLHRDFPHVHFFEVDHPATQQIKIRVLESQHVFSDRIRFVAADLGQKCWEKALLSRSDFRDGADTLVIAESVLMYLRPDNLDAIFRMLRGHTGPRSRFLFTFMEPTDKGTISFHNATRLLDVWLRWRGEPFSWGIRRQALPEFLSRQDFTPVELATCETLRTRYCPTDPTTLPLAEGECLCWAERSCQTAPPHVSI